jgi:methionine-rich copper-binding protein CopC
VTGVQVARAPAGPGVYRAVTAAGAVVVAAVLILLFAGGGGPARFTGLVPGDGAALTEQPTQVALAFTATPDVQVMHVTVVASDGSTVSRGLPQVAGAGIVQAVSTVTAGRYRVGYHVELADGTQISGLGYFTLASGAAAAPTGGEAGEIALPAQHQHELSRDPATLAFVLVDLALVLALIMVLLPRRRSR